MISAGGADVMLLLIFGAIYILPLLIFRIRADQFHDNPRDGFQRFGRDVLHGAVYSPCEACGVFCEGSEC